MGVFDGIQVVLEFGTSVRFKKKKELRSSITDNGGVISYIITKKSDYVIIEGINNPEDTYKCRAALKAGIPIVSADFIEQSIQAKRVLDRDLFLVTGKTKAQQFSLGKITGKQMAKSTQKKKLNVNTSGIKVWDYVNNAAPQFNESDYEIAKFAVFVSDSKVASGNSPGRRDAAGSNKSSLFGAKKETVKLGLAFYALELHVDLSHSKESLRYRVYCHRGTLPVDEKNDSSRTFSVTNSVDEALALFANWYKESAGMDLLRGPLPLGIGSKKLKRAYKENSLHGSVLPEGVSALVSHIWAESMGEIDNMLAGNLSTIGKEKVEKAEGLLKEMLVALDKGKDRAELMKLSDEFYAEIPHNAQHRNRLEDKKAVAKKLDLCQLIRDMYAVAESTDWSSKCSANAKYHALNCEIVPLTADSGPEHDHIHSLVKDSLLENEDISVKVYKVCRPMEEQNFTKNISNHRLLFHASSVTNFVGILSRGLLPPKVIVEEFGGTRSDVGMLGSGIYFSDSVTTSLKYSLPSTTKGTRMMAICEVALGEMYECFEYNKELKAPPSGYQSVHGVSRRHEQKSQFVDDEYVVYDKSQQQVKYLVEFWLQGEKISPDSQLPLDAALLSQNETYDQPDDTIPGNSDSQLDLTDVLNVQDPLDNVALGLVSTGDAQVPLKSVHVRAKLIDLVSRVVVLQEYTNETDEPIEAKYVFPLDDMAAVCGFEAFINGKHIVGEVKEKETAHQEYKKAISEGHGAYLMDRDEETPNIFTVSVGNLPPGATVLIKITYMAELLAEDERFNFVIPGTVAPWKKDKALGDVTQTQHDTMKIEDSARDTSIQVSIEMPFPIRSIDSPTHKILKKKTETRAVVEMAANQEIGSSFQLQIMLAEIHVPRMWVERHPDKHHGQDHYEACMLTFYPEFEAAENPSYEVVFMLDCSNSMRGKPSEEATKILLLTLQQLSSECSFNIVKFGTGFGELFPVSQMKTKQNMKLAENFLQRTDNFGNTDLHKPLCSYYLLKPEDAVRNIFLISDGHITHGETTLSSIKSHYQHTRLFTFGVSATANHHLLRCMAQAGAGYFEYFDSKVKSKWEKKVKAQLYKASQPVLTSVSIQWHQYDNEPKYCMQAPAKVTSIFSGSRLVVYGYVQDCTQATLKAIIDGKEVTTLVSTSELGITSGEILHQLTARAVIEDWETGLLDEKRIDHELTKRKRKDYIIQISMEYSIVTQFTSFVAIEKREEGEQFQGPSISKLVENETVDDLDYMLFTEEGKVCRYTLYGDELYDEEETSGEESYDEETSEEEEEAYDFICDDNVVHMDMALGHMSSDSEEDESEDDMGFSLFEKYGESYEDTLASRMSSGSSEISMKKGHRGQDEVKVEMAAAPRLSPEFGKQAFQFEARLPPSLPRSRPLKGLLPPVELYTDTTGYSSTSSKPGFGGAPLAQSTEFFMAPARLLHPSAQDRPSAVEQKQLNQVCMGQPVPLGVPPPPLQPEPLQEVCGMMGASIKASDHERFPASRKVHGSGQDKDMDLPQAKQPHAAFSFGAMENKSLDRQQALPAPTSIPGFTSSTGLFGASAPPPPPPPSLAPFQQQGQFKVFGKPPTAPGVLPTAAPGQEKDMDLPQAKQPCTGFSFAATENKSVRGFDQEKDMDLPQTKQPHAAFSFGATNRKSTLAWQQAMPIATSLPGLTSSTGLFWASPPAPPPPPPPPSLAPFQQQNQLKGFGKPPAASGVPRPKPPRDRGWIESPPCFKTLLSVEKPSIGKDGEIKDQLQKSLALKKKVFSFDDEICETRGRVDKTPSSEEEVSVTPPTPHRRRIRRGAVASESYDLPSDVVEDSVLPSEPSSSLEIQSGDRSVQKGRFGRGKRYMSLDTRLDYQERSVMTSQSGNLEQHRVMRATTKEAGKMKAKKVGHAKVRVPSTIPKQSTGSIRRTPGDLCRKIFSEELDDSAEDETMEGSYQGRPARLADFIAERKPKSKLAADLAKFPLGDGVAKTTSEMFFATSCPDTSDEKVGMDYLSFPDEAQAIPDWLKMFDTNPYRASQESEGYFSDSGPQSVLIQPEMNKLMHQEIRQLFRLVTKEYEATNKVTAFWDLKHKLELENILRISLDACSNFLQDAGLHSMGIKVETNIKRLITTLLVIYHIVLSCRPQTSPLLYKIWLTMEIDDEFDENLREVLRFCKQVDDQFPLVYSTLELGSSWDDVIHQWLDLKN